jgi:hypothetical protein
VQLLIRVFKYVRVQGFKLLIRRMFTLQTWSWKCRTPSEGLNTGMVLGMPSPAVFESGSRGSEMI